MSTIGNEAVSRRVDTGVPSSAEADVVNGSALHVPSRTVAEATARQLSVGRRTAALITVCASLMVITIDVTVLNVAVPTLAEALEADNSSLQWFINAYELVFAGLLLTAGAIADRFGRRRVLGIGLAVFGAASAMSALAETSSQLIGARD